MNTSIKQDQDFIHQIVKENLPNDLLEQASDWIAKNFTPDDVFPSDELVDWANDNIDLLDENKLEKWAEANGYTKD